MTSEASKKAAGKRVLKARDLLYRATELLEKAQSQISVVVGGLNQNYTKIDGLRSKIKSQMYDLERCYDTGRCDLDGTTRQMLTK